MPARQRGSAYRRKSGWAVRWYEGGRRRARGRFSSKQEALDYFSEQIAPRLGLAFSQEPSPSMAEFAERFLAAYAAEVDPRTVRTLRERLRRPLAAFGSRSLGDLERSIPELAAWAAGLPEGYRPKVMGALAQVLDKACAWRLMRENPARLARVGKRRVAQRREPEPFSREEIDRIARELGPRLGPLIVFAAESGLRPGELAALERADIDREAGVILVRRVYASGRFKEPKTEKSRRRVPLTARAAAALDVLPPRLDSRLCFPAPGGGPLDLHNFARRDWHPALEAAGVAPRRVYDLRHTFASHALAAGVSLFELSRFMGASVRVLEMHYAHLLPSAEDSARAKLDAAAAAG